jgi:uncharacterized membrane-anchored protein YjiN (DUF445 family)
MASNRSASTSAPTAPGGNGFTDELARARLARNRLLAQGMLVAMGGTFLATHLVEQPGFAVGLLRAGAEAGLVGGIADWFAVTALFRHPFGLPIPHTAIVPRNQERIGQTLGGFVQRHFLTEEVLLRKLRDGRFGQRFCDWLATPRAGRLIAGPAATALAQVLRSLGNRELRALIDRTLVDRVRAADAAPALGRLLRLLTQSGEADAFFDRAVEAGIRWLDANRDRIGALVGEHSRWWVPKTVDRRVAEAIAADVAGILTALRARDGDARLRLRAALAELVEELLTSPEQRAQVNAAKNRLLEHPELRAWLAAAWQEFARDALDELERPGSRTRATLARGLTLLGRALAEDPAMQAQIEALLERLAGLLVSWRGEIGGFISDVVRSWDIRTLSDRLELTVGSDLQYIRMNGTVVGACVGCALFVLSWLVFPAAVT